jgi:sterol desaturase/sphingolipid hydroxylase (fatty acid hydroxylase superfamily)
VPAPLERVEFIRSYLGACTGAGLGVLEACAFFLTLETLFPRAGGARVSMGSRAKAILFWQVNLSIIILIAYGVRALVPPLDLRPLLPSLAAGLPGPVGVVVSVAAAAFVGDFFYYWCHRLQHRFFWRFHAVHHSVAEMSGITAYHHFTEPLFETVLFAIPLSLLTTNPNAIPVLGGLLAWQGSYEHSPTRLNFGPLGRYFVDNRFHRIHHSADPSHFGKNFGIFTTLWDSLFGTAYFPAPAEWPRTGVAEMPEPASIGDLLLAPARWRSPPNDAAIVRDAPEQGG